MVQGSAVFRMKSGTVAVYGCGLIYLLTFLRGKVLCNYLHSKVLFSLIQSTFFEFEEKQLSSLDPNNQNHPIKP